MALFLCCALIFIWLKNEHTQNRKNTENLSNYHAMWQCELVPRNERGRNYVVSTTWSRCSGFGFCSVISVILLSWSNGCFGVCWVALRWVEYAVCAWCAALYARTTTRHEYFVRIVRIVCHAPNALVRECISGVTVIELGDNLKSSVVEKHFSVKHQAA